ncbi:MAG TPA: SPOR domain-containing protein [Gemmatimonadales bacterium]|nr:SPOR domain-containing protein [Gemmatimonadales bacterium]
MTVRALPRSRLDALVPSLVAGQALVALVPATGDLKWAGGAAWDVARAAAQGDRRVALVDLWLEEPTLHDVVGVTPTEGIVDAFEYDVSLTKAAHEVDHVFFIAAGTATTHAGELFASPRWRRLQGGFRVEGALLLLYLSAGALARLSAVPDGLIVLSPDGFEPESSIGQGVSAAMERGVPLLGVVRERWTPGPLAAPDVGPARPPRRAAAGGPGPARPARRTRPAVVVATVAAGAVGGWALLVRGAEHGPAAPAARPPRAAAPAVVAPPVAPPAPRVDTVAWSVQLAAYATLDKALAVGERLATNGITPFVTPIAVGPRHATVWYRVLAGAYPTRDSALAGRAGLWARGLAARGRGDVLRAPYTLVLKRAAPADSLRTQGIPPAIRWGAKPELVVGAFESPEQASLTETRLTHAGVRATLVTRVRTAR